MELPPEHSRVFGYMDTRDWGEASARTPTSTALAGKSSSRFAKDSDPALSGGKS